MSLLEKVIEIISKGDQELTLEIKNQGSGRVLLKVSPLVGNVAENASEAEKQLKAALSVPLKVVGSLSEIESSIVSRIESYKVQRTAWEKQLLTINNKINDASSEENKKGSVKVPDSKAEAVKEVVASVNNAVEETVLEDDFEL